MDIRIVNTCNNNCLYCLEQELRTQQKFYSVESIFDSITTWKDKNITFYWWNPLLHPDIQTIIKSAHNHWVSSIGVLSNTYTLSKENLESLKNAWLTDFWFYFYSFHSKIHEIYSGWWIALELLLENILLLKASWLRVKAIIHVHKWNIKTLSNDVKILYKKFWITHFEFIDYLIEDRAKKYNQLLSYSIAENREEINNLFSQIKQLNIRVKFVRFKKDFFWDFKEYKDELWQKI